MNRDDKYSTSDEEVNQVSHCLISDARLHLLLPELNGQNQEKRRQIIIDNKLVVKRGKYSREEDMILTRNWNTFCETYGVNEDMKYHLLGYFNRSKNSSKRLRKEIKTLREKESFMLRLAYGLPNRTLISIHLRARHLLCNFNRINDINGEVMSTLVNLRCKRKYAWVKIAEKTKYHPIDVRNNVLNNYNKEGMPYNRGHFNCSEDIMLINALKVYFNIENLSDKIYDKNINWNKVQELSGINRYSERCKERWNKILRWKLIYNQNDSEEWKIKYSARLVYLLFRCNYDNELDIDWDFIKEKFAQNVSFNTVCKNWRILKSSVPDFASKSYKQIVNYLYEHLLSDFVKTDEDLRELEELLVE